MPRIALINAEWSAERIIIKLITLLIGFNRKKSCKSRKKRYNYGSGNQKTHGAKIASWALNLVYRRMAMSVAPAMVSATPKSAIGSVLT